MNFFSFAVFVLILHSTNLIASCPTAAEIYEQVIRYFPATFDTKVGLLSQIPKDVVQASSGRKWKLEYYTVFPLKEMPVRVHLTHDDSQAKLPRCTYATSDGIRKDRYYLKPSEVTFAEIKTPFDITSSGFYRVDLEETDKAHASGINTIVRPSSEPGIYTLSFKLNTVAGNVRLAPGEVSSEAALLAAKNRYYSVFLSKLSSGQQW